MLDFVLFVLAVITWIVIFRALTRRLDRMIVLLESLSRTVDAAKYEQDKVRRGIEAV